MSTPSLRALSVFSMLAAASASAMGHESEGDQGIASGYPGDVGINADPDVVFVEDFEAALADVLARWNDIKSDGSMSPSSDVPAASSGTSSLLMHKTPGGGCRVVVRMDAKPREGAVLVKLIHPWLTRVFRKRLEADLEALKMMLEAQT